MKRRNLRDFYLALMVGGQLSLCCPCKLSYANACPTFQMMEIPLKGRGPFTVFAPTTEAFQEMKTGKVTRESFCL